MSVYALDPWNKPVAPVREPITQDESDAIYDDVYDAMHDDRALLPEGFWFLFAAFRTLAQTSADPDGFAAQTCRQLVQRARTGVPMNEPMEGN